MGHVTYPKFGYILWVLFLKTFHDFAVFCMSRVVIAMLLMDVFEDFIGVCWTQKVFINHSLFHIVSVEPAGRNHEHPVRSSSKLSTWQPSPKTGASFDAMHRFVRDGMKDAELQNAKTYKHIQNCLFFQENLSRSGASQWNIHEGSCSVWFWTSLELSAEPHGVSSLNDMKRWNQGTGNACNARSGFNSSRIFER